LNHLWQSTLFALPIGFLTLAFRRKVARIRYGLWLAASLKFLLPFSLLVTAGASLNWTTFSAAPSPPFAVAIEQVSRPFAVSAPAVSIRSTRTTSAADIVFVLWACGFVAIAVLWCIRWSLLRAEVRAAEPLHLDAHVTARSSHTMREPGVFGIFRPIIILPQGITQRLTPPELKAILAHELSHIQNHDNLTAAAHMLVEALFWFHPLVWWIGARLVDERERACDEEVIRLGNPPQTYAQGILKTCEFYLASPLACMAGVSGSDLTQRVSRIMTTHSTYRLGAIGKLLLTSVAVSSLAVPFALGLLSAQPGRAQTAVAPSEPAFAAVSIKPHDSARTTDFENLKVNGNQWTATNFSLKKLVALAYGVQESEIAEGAAWIGSEKYDIEAQAPPARESAKSAEDRLQIMLRTFLAERFKLTVHRQSTEAQVYALLVSKGGPKLHKSGTGPLPKVELKDLNIGPNDLVSEMRGVGAQMSFLAASLSHDLNRPVIDKTGLQGFYDYALSFTPNNDKGLSIFVALESQLGLRLELQESKVDFLIIDHAEKP
jgi:uncharacterized protein (TIGR03435 family)